MLFRVPLSAHIGLMAVLISTPLARGQFPPDGATAGSQPTVTPFTPPAARRADDLSEHAQVQQLPNGMRILVVSDHTYPLLSVQTWFSVGSAADADTPGTCDVARVILEHGESGALKLRSAGVEFESRTLADATVFASTFPADPKMLDFVLGIEFQRFVTKPTTKDAVASATQAMRLAHNLEQTHTPRVPANAATRQRELNSDSRDELLALAAPLGKALFAGHSYAAVRQPPEPDPIAAVQLDDFLQTWFVPANATLLIVGDIDLDTAFAHAEPRFTPLPRRDRPRRPAEDLPQQRRCDLTSGATNLENAEALQFCWQTPYFADFTNVAIETLMQRLCNPVDGPLFGRLRAANLSPPRWNLDRWRDAGILLIQIDLAPPHTQSAAPASAPSADLAQRLIAIRAAVAEEIQRAADTRPSEVELIRARRLTERDAFRARRDFLSYAALLGRCEIVGGDVLLADFDLPRPQRVTVGALQDAATYLLEANAGVCVIARSAAAEPDAPNCEFLDPSELLAALRAAAPRTPIASPTPAPPPLREWRSPGDLLVRAGQFGGPGALVVLKTADASPSRASGGLADTRHRDFASFRGFDFAPSAPADAAAAAACWISDPAELDTLLEFAAQSARRDTSRNAAASQPSNSAAPFASIQIISAQPLDAVRQSVAEGLQIELSETAATSGSAAAAPSDGSGGHAVVTAADPAMPIEIELTLTLVDGVPQTSPALERIIGRLVGVPDRAGMLLDEKRAARWRYRIPAARRITFLARTAAPASAAEAELTQLYARLRDRLRVLQTGAVPPPELEFATQFAQVDTYADFAGPLNLVNALESGRTGQAAASRPDSPSTSQPHPPTITPAAIADALRGVHPHIIQRGGPADAPRRSGLVSN